MQKQASELHPSLVKPRADVLDDETEEERVARREHAERGRLRANPPLGTTVKSKYDEERRQARG